MQDVCSDAHKIWMSKLMLTAFIVKVAAETTAELGFRWRATDTVPTTLEDLTAEFRSSQITGLPIRVSSLHCTDTIYVDPIYNQAFRFVHDSRHVFLQAGFETEPELLVASCHLARLRHEGYRPETMEFRMLYADTVGQTLFTAETGQFVVNQLRFAVRCLDRPLQQAIKEEASLQVEETA